MPLFVIVPGVIGLVLTLIAAAMRYDKLLRRVRQVKGVA